MELRTELVGEALMNGKRLGPATGHGAIRNVESGNEDRDSQ